MESVVKAVQSGRGRRGRWPSEQKLAILQEWRSGVPLEEVCRKYGVQAALVYRWKRSLDQGLKESGELIPRSQVAALELTRFRGHLTCSCIVHPKGRSPHAEGQAFISTGVQG